MPTYVSELIDTSFIQISLCLVRIQRDHPRLYITKAGDVSLLEDKRQVDGDSPRRNARRMSIGDSKQEISRGDVGPTETPCLIYFSDSGGRYRSSFVSSSRYSVETKIRPVVGITTAERNQPSIRAIFLLPDGGFDEPHSPFTLYGMEFSANIG